MARHSFEIGSTYPARLLNVWSKPIENQSVRLLRLEFEVFRENSEQRLVATGEIACRDVVAGDGVDVGKDRGVAPYVRALGGFDASRVANWLHLAEGKSKPWVKITFGDMHEGDHRNSFQRIEAFDAGGYAVAEYAFDQDRDWLKVGDVARKMKCSENTVRRRLQELEPEHGARLVRRTSGGQRMICWPRLRNLL